jgi:hypothetical protein
VSAAFTPAACPRCGQFDSVQRVAGIVASQNSALSWELRAPQPPGAPAVRRRGNGMRAWPWLLLLLLVTLPLDIVVLVVLAAVAAVLIVLLAAVAVAAALAYGVYRYLNRHVIADRKLRQAQERAETMRRYQHALAYWNQLHYCHRCHGVFLPDNQWQYERITVPGALVAPGHAWAVSEQLGGYVERLHAPEVLRLEDGQP